MPILHRRPKCAKQPRAQCAGEPGHGHPPTKLSAARVKSLADSVIENAASIDLKPLGVEGMENGEWILIDLTDVVVHVMLPKVREFYDIERLWSMSPSKKGF